MTTNEVREDVPKGGRAPTKSRVPFVSLTVSVVAVLCAGELGAAYFLGGGLFLDRMGVSCEKSGKRMAQVSSASVVPPPPAGAALLEGHEEAGGECMEDSGAPWLAIDRYYRFNGGREAVVIHYRQAAEKSGWMPSGPESAEASASEAPFDVCFDKDLAGAPALLRLRFESTRTFLMSVESSLDGEPMEC
ncbi:hypothetical protein AB0420_22165 [Streptomyces caelestis]|uniref:hypothetical protein n=1 Tax=Streptomyces caelestis TaxID=36816 RepID=UPI00344B70FE